MPKVEVLGHAHYEFEHGHRPRGRGGWLFSPVNPYGREPYLEHMSPSFNGTFGEAVKAAKAWAKEKGHAVLWVCP